MPVILTRRDTVSIVAIASTVSNDSAIPGSSVKDALEFLDGDKVSYNFENNTISGTGDIYAGSYFGNGSNLTGIDHGTTSGLGDDDHPQYSLADGTRSFTGTVGGITPVSDVDLTTKLYVDLEITTATGALIQSHNNLSGIQGGASNDYIHLTSTRHTDLTDGGDTTLHGHDHDGLTNFVADEHVAHSSISISSGGILSGGGTIDSNQTITLASSDVDHGGISGLSADDHSKYPLVDGTRGFIGVVPGILPTASTHLTTKGYVDGLIQGLDWRDSVLSISGCTPPGGPSTGDRYIVCSTSGVGDWNGMEDYVVEYNGTSWSGSVPNEGFASWVEDEDALYVYNGTAWVKFGSTITHNNTSGKQGGNGIDEFYHFNITDYTALVAANRGETVSDIVGTMVTGNTETYITVTYEDGDNTLDFVVNTATDGGTLGVATFAAADFNVVGGTVNLDDTVPQSVSSDSGSATPAVNAFTIAGGEGIDTSGAGSTITIAGEDATSANKGIASFDSGDFTVTSGDVVIDAITDGKLVSSYVYADGTRAFSNTISGVSPTLGPHLTTKSYVDFEITTATGSLTSAHGDLTGLSADDHTQYILVNGSRAFTGNILPNASGTLDLGSASMPFNNLYLDGTSLYMSDFEVMYLVGNGLVLKSPSGNPITLTTNGGDALITDSSGGIKLNTGSQYVNEFSTDGTFAGNSNAAVPTEKAIKTYVNTVSGAIGGGGVSNHSELNELDFASAGHTGFLDQVVTDTSPQLGGDLDTNQKSIVLDPTPSSDDTGIGIKTTETVDVNSQGVGAPLFIASDGNFEICSADAVATMPCVAMALGTGTGSKEVLWFGIMRNDGWNWTSLGDPVYVSTTSGTLTQTAPSASGEQVQRIGIAKSADIILFNPDYTTVEIA